MITKLILHGREDEMTGLLQAFQAAQRNYPMGVGCQGLLGLRFNGAFYSIKWNRPGRGGRVSVSVWAGNDPTDR